MKPLAEQAWGGRPTMEWIGEKIAKVIEIEGRVGTWIIFVSLAAFAGVLSSMVCNGSYVTVVGG